MARMKDLFTGLHTPPKTISIRVIPYKPQHAGDYIPENPSARRTADGQHTNRYQEN